MKISFDRRRFLKAAGLGVAGAMFPGCLEQLQQAGGGGDKPNILFIMLDDLGPEWVSCYGAEDIETPNADKLALEGMRFLNAYSMPKCTPTRATLMTGQYPFRHGWVNHWDVPRWGAGCHFDWRHYTMFSHVMKSAGYTTAVAGKWQVNDFRVTPDAMVKHGFDDYCMWTGYETGNPPSGERYWDPYLHTNRGSKTYKGQFSEDIFTDFLLDFMRRNKAKPMMMYYPMCLPHGPVTTTPLEPNAKSNKDQFKAMVRYCDFLLGKLVRGIDDLGIRENTIVIWTTDNGTAGSETGRMNGRAVKGGKGEISENGCGAPFIVNCPGRVPGGVVTDALTDFTDMLPTFAELGGAKVPDDTVIDGHSIAKFILGETDDTSRQWIMAMGGGTAKLTDEGVIPAVEYADRVIRDKRYKLWVENGKSTRLFDMVKDPGEENNLIDSSNRKVVAARKKLQAAVKTFGKKDAAPKYDPTPPRKWDITKDNDYKVTVTVGKKKR